MDKPKIVLPTWMAEAYTRYLTQTPIKPKKSLTDLTIEWLLKTETQQSFIKHLMDKFDLWRVDKK